MADPDRKVDPLEDDDESEGEEYEVEKILRCKKTKGEMFYLVHWKGYTSDDDTWEPEENLVDCAEIFNEFKRQYKLKEDAEKEAQEQIEAKRKAEKEKKKALNPLLGQKRRREEPPAKPKEKLPQKLSLPANDMLSDSLKSKIKKKEKKKDIKPRKKFLSMSDEEEAPPSTIKIPKIPRTPKETPKVVDDADKFFQSPDHDNYPSYTPVKREKKKKKRHEERHESPRPPPPNHAQQPLAEPEPDMFAMYNLDDLILPFGVDITVPGADGVFRVTTPIQSEFEDPSGKMSGLDNINWSLGVYADALDLLIRSNCIQDVETLLLKQKLNVNHLYGEKTLVSLAALHGKKRMTKMLLRYQPDVNQVLDKGQFALHLAAQYGHTEICLCLIEAGANINARDAILETALMKAADGGHSATVELLLDLGSNFSLVNASFKTALEICREKQYEFIAQKIFFHSERITDSFINVHKGGGTLKGQLLPIHIVFPEFNSTYALCFKTEEPITCKLIVSRLVIRKGDIGRLHDFTLIKCQWMNEILSLESPGSVTFPPRIGLNTLVLNFKEHIKKYGIEPLLVSAFSFIVKKRDA